MKNPTTRRHFLMSAAAVGATHLSPAQTRGLAPSGTLRTAHIGVGGMGSADLTSIASHSAVEVTALCDIDLARLTGAHAKYPRAKTFRDFREMFSDLENSIDAVVVSTPDHTHAPAAMTALNHNKPVYCQKPLTHEVFEARQLRRVAEQKSLPTQMGIQVHSAAVYRRAVQIIQQGTIGKVSRVHAWSHKNWGYDGGAISKQHSVPDTIDWNLWIGTASMRPYIGHELHPGNWRRFIDFGTGTLGDMGVHIFDTPYAALELTAPKWAQATCRQPTNLGHPESNKIQYEFPGTKYTTETLRWIWHDGTFAPPTAQQLGLAEDLLVPKQGSLFVGEVGTLLLPHVGEAQLLPIKQFQDYQRPTVSEENHYHQWVEACLGNGSTSASFSYAGPLTETLLLGVVANRFPETKLLWDAKNLQVTNSADATRLLRREYRDGFSVAGL